MNVCKSKRCYNVKTSTYFVHMKTKILADFQICNSVALINNCPGKSENLKPQGSLRVLLFLCFLFRSGPPKLLSKAAILNFLKIPLETPAVDSCFWNWIVQHVVLRILKQLFLEMSWLIALTKSSHRRCSIKKMFLKTSQYLQENTCVGVSF